MRIDISFLPALALAFILIFARIGVMVMLLPAIGESAMPARMRLTLALLLSAILLPLHRTEYAVDTSAYGPMLTMLGKEMLVGATLGITVRLTLSALQVAGTVVAQQLGLGFVTAVDPTQGGQQNVIVGNFLAVLAVTMIFATDMHHMVIAALNDSYRLFRPGDVPIPGDIAIVQSRSRHSLATDAADAGVLRRVAGLDPGGAHAAGAGRQRDDGLLPRLSRKCPRRVDTLSRGQRWPRDRTTPRKQKTLPKNGWTTRSNVATSPRARSSIPGSSSRRLRSPCPLSPAAWAPG